jgi:hypothetical protein
VLSSPPLIVFHAGLPVYEPDPVVEGGLVIAIVNDPVIDFSAGSVVVASSAPRTDMTDACDCKAWISPAMVVLSHQLRKLTMACSNPDCDSNPPFSIA